MQQTSTEQKWMPPRLFMPGQSIDDKDMKKLLDSDRAIEVIDTTPYAVEELYDFEYPQEKDLEIKSSLEVFSKKFNNSSYGVWVYFPWQKKIVRFPLREDLRKLRTSRNRNLITESEQKKLYQARIFIAGLSVGSNAVEAHVSQGIGGSFSMADMDVIEPSNLNRIRAPYSSVGTHKIDFIAKTISEIDPFIEQEHYREGLTEKNIDEIISRKPSVIIDEIDSLHMKVILRQKAKESKIPVISAADDGEGTLLEIERYDINPQAELLNGRLPKEIISRIIAKEYIPRNELGMIIGKYFIGPEHIPLRMFESLKEVGKTLPSWPQLGGAAALSGVALAYCSKRIILGQSLSSGRFAMGFDQALNPEIQTDKYKAALQEFIKKMS